MEKHFKISKIFHYSLNIKKSLESNESVIMFKTSLDIRSQISLRQQTTRIKFIKDTNSYKIIQQLNKISNSSNKLHFKLHKHP